MTRTIIFLILILTGCANSKSKKQNRLATEMTAFLTSGKYDVQVIDLDRQSKLSTPINAQLTLTNNLGLVEFKGINSFSELDSIKISLIDSTLVRQFSVNPFIDTTSVPADKSGINEYYFGYAFGRDYLGGIADIPEFRQFFKKENISGSQFLFIVGRTKNNDIIIRRIERVVSSGEKVMDVNKVYVLNLKNFR